MVTQEEICCPNCGATFTNTIPPKESPFDKRRAGVLLPITSLPTSCGWGTLGRHASRFVDDFFKKCGFSVWQMLPIHPTNPQDLSPYQPISSFAGNPLLINIQDLMERGWLPRQRVLRCNRREQLENSFAFRRDSLRKSYEYFFERVDKKVHQDYQHFVRENDCWLKFYAVFQTLKEQYQNKAWWEWEQHHRNYSRELFEQLEKTQPLKIRYYYFEQFVFFEQWKNLKNYANQQGIYLIGDMPHFVALDSVDVWANRQLFLLDQNDRPLYLSGTPEGLNWGHPLYNWDYIESQHFDYWLERFKMMEKLFDGVRLTYFQGFYKCWGIHYSDQNNLQSNQGEWLDVFAGKKLLEKVIEQTRLKIITDDLGATPEAIQLRNNFKFSGIKILQKGFDFENTEQRLNNYALLHQHLPRDVVCTGTHDSEPLAAWLECIKKNQPERFQYICNYLGSTSEKFHWDFIKATLRSISKLAIIPMQDILELKEEARMNILGEINNQNWRWGFEWTQVTPDLQNKLKNIIEDYER